MKRTRRPRTHAVGANGGTQDAARRHDLDQNVTLRDKQILALRLAQTPISEIQKRFGISRMTVYRSLTMAQRRAFQDHAIDAIIEDLLPKALAAYDIALDAGDTEVATKVIEGLGILGKHVTVATTPQGGTVETFEEYRARIVRRTAAPGEPSSDQVSLAAEHDGAVDSAVPGNAPLDAPDDQPRGGELGIQDAELFAGEDTE
jgi:DNA-binding CsgD family transcriptional regulator